LVRITPRRKYHLIFFIFSGIFIFQIVLFLSTGMFTDRRLPDAAEKHQHTSLHKTGKAALFAGDVWLHLPPKPQLLPPELSGEDAATHGALDPPDGIQRPTHELHKE
jgi:hypothetical protein